MGFQDDERWFEQNRAYIALQYQGQWIIVLGASVRGAFPTKADAFNAAVKQFGPQAGFLIVQSDSIESIKLGSWAT